MTTVLKGFRIKVLTWLGGIALEKHEELQQELKHEKADILQRIEAIQQRLSYTRTELHNTKSSLQALESTINNKMINNILADISYNISKTIKTRIVDAIKKSGYPTENEYVSIEFAVSDLRFIDNTGIENIVLEEWKLKCADKMSTKALLNPTAAATDKAVAVLDINIPQLGYRHVLWN